MSSESWREATLGDCATLVRNTVSPSECGNAPYIGLEHIGEGTLSLLDHGVASEVTSAKAQFHSGDILFGKLRPYFRKVVRPRFDGICSTDIWVVQPIGDVDPGYLFYLMASQQFVDFATAGSEGTKMPRAKWEHVSRYPVPLPPLDEQRRIAHILGALDDKIELNRRMSETLEAMAQALFKSWFVDFDPVRAKAEGRPTGLPPDLDALFPDSFQDSELGEIPEGWAVATLGDVCRKPQYGYTQSAQTEPVGPKFLRITDINKQPWVEWESVPHCEITSEDIEKYRLHHGDILIARMADPGHGCMVEGEPDAVFASYLIRFRPIHERYGRYLQYWLRSESYWELVRGRRTGTTRANLNAKALSGFPLLIPPHHLLSDFGDGVDGLRARVVANIAESHSLSVQRDTLMPRAISSAFGQDPHEPGGS